MAKPGNGKQTGRLASTTLSALSALDAMWDCVDQIKRDVIGDCLMERPPNSITVREYVDRYRVASSTAKRQLDIMAKSGKVTKQRAMIPDDIARVVPTIVYVVNAA